jgi:hypothetical protein
MDAQSNSKVIPQDKTLADYINRTMQRIEEEKHNPNQYPVYPEDDGTDAKRNPYSDV